MSENEFSPIRWHQDHLELLDQTLLPRVESWLECREPSQVADAIRCLAVRGAPAIGVAAAYGLALAIQPPRKASQFAAAFDELLGTRPTAVNLRWALEQGRALFDRYRHGDELFPRLLEWAHRLHREDIDTNRRIGAHGATLFDRRQRVLTHCNAGALATAGYGTAVGVIHSAYDDGHIEQVWVDETRPLLQGARLTAWELEQLGVPYRLVTDSSVGTLMAQGKVDAVVVGADRIARNGDVANKIGTYTVAVLANRHQVPFYVAAPLSTCDLDTPTGADIPIEERQSGEVTEVFGTQIAPAETEAVNFAFDVTPNELVTAILTEVGVLRAPYEEALTRAFETRDCNTP